MRFITPSHNTTLVPGFVLTVIYMPNFHSSLFTDLSDVETNNSFDVLSELSEDFPDDRTSIDLALEIDKPTKTSSPVKDKCNSNKPRKVYKIRNSIPDLNLNQRYVT